MADLAHWFDNDLNQSAAGDLLAVSGVVEQEQQLIREFLTPPGTYIWHPTWGDGLGQYIGKPNAAKIIAAKLRAGLLRKTFVAQNPPPQVSVTTNASGVTVASVGYWNNLTNSVRTLSFPIN